RLLRFLLPRRPNFLRRQFIAWINLQRPQELRQRARNVTLVAQRFAVLYVQSRRRKSRPLPGRFVEDVLRLFLVRLVIVLIRCLNIVARLRLLSQLVELGGRRTMAAHQHTWTEAE